MCAQQHGQATADVWLARRSALKHGHAIQAMDGRNVQIPLGHTKAKRMQPGTCKWHSGMGYRYEE